MENLEQNQPTAEKPSAESMVDVPETKPQKPPLSPLFLILLSLFMFVLGGAVVFAYFTFLKPEEVMPQPTVSPSPLPTPVSSPSPSPDEMADWKIYTNTEHGFQIKFPNNWFSNDCGFNDVLLLNSQGMPICETEPFDPIILNIDAQSKTKEEYEGKWESVNFKITEKRSIGNATGYKLEKAAPAPGPDEFSVIIIPLKTGMLQITINDLNFESVANLMLQTFKFTE